MPDLTLIRAFVTVAREGNLTRAAQKLHLTQPAVSLQIRALQETLQLQLFQRIPAGMQLSHDGAKLLPLAEKVLATVGEFSVAADNLHSTLSGQLGLGTILDPEFLRLGPFLQRLVESYPQVSTRLQHGMSGWVLQQVQNGALDAGFYLGQPPSDAKNPCHCLTLTEFTYRVVAPNGWKSRIVGKDWAALAQLPWIWTPPESAHNRLLSEVFSRLKLTPHVVALVDQEPSMLDMVKSGIGLCLVRESIAMREAHTYGLTIADAVSLSTELSFICLKKRAHDSLIAAVFALLRQCWNQD